MGLAVTQLHGPKRTSLRLMQRAIPYTGPALLLNKHAAHRKRQANPPTRRTCATGSNDSEQPETVDLSTASTDWRSFRAKLIAAEKGKLEPQEGTKPEPSTAEKGTSAGDASPSGSAEDIWAHQISAPENGCLLMARPSGGDMGFFNNSTILLLQHELHRGSMGLLLGRKLKKRPQGPFAQVMAMITGIYLGGPVNLDSLIILHGMPAIERSAEVLQGIFVGGWREAKAALSGLNPEADSLPHISVFSGSCGWAPGQLEHEERTGAWWVVAASPQLIKFFLQESSEEEAIKSQLMDLTGIQEE